MVRNSGDRVDALEWHPWHDPTQRPYCTPAITSGTVTVVLVIGTQLALAMSPSITTDALAVFGTMGVLLIWLYGLGVVVVAVPMAVGATKAAIGDLKQR